MKYSVTVPSDTFEAAKEAARQAGISSAEWSRLAIVAALTPKGPDPDLERARSDLAQTREERDSLASDAAEVERLRDDLAICNQTLKENGDRIMALKMQTDQYRDQVQILEERARAAELRVALGEKDLEVSESRRQGLQDAIDRQDQHINDLKATNSHYEGEIARVVTEANRALPATGKPWWAFWRIP